MTPPPARPIGYRAAGEAFLGAVVLTTAGAGCWMWLSGQLAAWVTGRRWPNVGVTQSLVILDRLPAHLTDPAAAWPPAVRSGLPGPIALYSCACLVLVALLAAAAGGIAISQRMRPTTHRIWGPSGRRQRTTGARWATSTDLRPLRVGAGRRGRLILGRSEGGVVRGWPSHRRLLATGSRHSVLVIGPTQSGKTTGLAVPALLEWRGPIIATSVKDDLAATTVRWRSRQGPCWLFDPTETSGMRPLAGWSPLSMCTNWSDTQRLAGWLVDATPARTGMADAAFWYAAAAKQLAPLLLAAERGGLGMADVVRWTNTGAFTEPLQLLELSGDSDAAVALAACEARDPRILSSVGTTLETVLAPFEDPVVARSASGTDIDLDRLLDAGGTLYLCGPSHEQHRIQGLFAALVSAAVATAIRRVNQTGRCLDPPLLVVLDEAANIAPLRDLDTLASTGAGLGMQLVTVCQDLAQLASRYGQERARTIANNHRAKVLLSGVSDLGTLDLVSGLVGEQAVQEETVTHDLRDGGGSRSKAMAFRRLAPTDELRRIPPGRGVLVYGHLPPIRLRLRPWYADHRLRQRATPPPAPA